MKASNSTRKLIADGISYIDGFLSAAECDSILHELDAAYWQESLTYKKQATGVYRDELTDFRVSQTAHQEWFSDDLNKILAKTEKRLQKIFHFKIPNLEAWQATDYPLKGRFDYHLDAGYWDNHYAGDRILTFLLYLTTPLKGGGTHFRALDIYVKAKKGKLLIWENLFTNGDPNYGMIHSSVPLLGGKKTTLVSWQREKKYRK